MFCEGKRDSNLDKLVEAISGVKGVVLAILFGSRAKGKSDEYSDYDLLVVFENDRARRENSDELYARLAKTGLFVQALALSLNELRKIDPVFLGEVFKHGKILYSRYPV